MEENEFWLKFWTLVAIVLVAVVGSLYYYSKHEATLRMEAWIKCVEVGGQPVSQPMLGTQSLTFTCVRK